MKKRKQPEKSISKIEKTVKKEKNKESIDSKKANGRKGKEKRNRNEKV